MLQTILIIHIPPVQHASWVFRINFVLSKSPHFQRGYLVTVRKHMSIIVYLALSQAKANGLLRKREKKCLKMCSCIQVG